MPSPLMRERPAPDGGDDYKAPLAVFECIIERVTFHNAENGYAVVKVTPLEAKAKAKGDVITVLGSFTNPTGGESLRCHGQWVKHPQFGSQFKMERYETLRPATAAAIEKYLGSGMVKGIGPKMAEADGQEVRRPDAGSDRAFPEEIAGRVRLGRKAH